MHAMYAVDNMSSLTPEQMFYRMKPEGSRQRRSGMTAVQTASNQPTIRSKRSTHVDPDGTAIIDRLLTPAEAARQLKCSRNQVYRLIQRRDLPALHFGRLWRLRPVDLRTYAGAGGGARTDDRTASEPGKDDQDRMLFVQSAKGAPLSVLVALAWAGRYLSHRELQIWTRYGHVQITVALQSLTRLGWVWARTPRGPWRLASGHQVPLAFTPICTSALKALNDGDDTLREGQDSKEPTPSSARSGELMKALADCRIWEPTASRIAALPHVTPEYIRAHVAQARREGLRVGAAIARIELGAPLPPGGEDQARSRQDDVDEKIRRFIEG